MTDVDSLVDRIDQPGIDSDPSCDIQKLKPDITQAEALAVQLAVKRRHQAAGDRIIGHQASFTSASVRSIFPDAPHPMIGTLLASIVRQDGDEVELASDDVLIEGEIALLLGGTLEGPELSPLDVLAATDAFLPAIEVAPLRPGVLERKYSWLHQIAVQKAFGVYIVFGSRLTSARGIDPRFEACLVSIDGEQRAAATGYEAMGDPLNVVVAIAAGLHEIGEKLHAGQIILTGSLAHPQRISRANRVAHVQFANLGSVSIRWR